MLVGTFNQEEALVLVGAFSVIVKSSDSLRFKLYCHLSPWQCNSGTHLEVLLAERGRRAAVVTSTSGRARGPLPHRRAAQRGLAVGPANIF